MSNSWRYRITVNCEITCLSDTLWVPFDGFMSKALSTASEIYGFWPTWPSSSVKVLVTRVKFLQPSGYCSVLNCAFTFWKTSFELSPSRYSWSYICKTRICSYIGATFKLNSVWNNRKRVSVSTNTIQPSTVDSYHRLKNALIKLHIKLYIISSSYIPSSYI